jgi:hypothetical protein
VQSRQSCGPPFLGVARLEFELAAESYGAIVGMTVTERISDDGTRTVTLLESRPSEKVAAQ